MHVCIMTLVSVCFALPEPSPPPRPVVAGGLHTKWREFKNDPMGSLLRQESSIIEVPIEAIKAELPLPGLHPRDYGGAIVTIAETYIDGPKFMLHFRKKDSEKVIAAKGKTLKVRAKISGLVTDGTYVFVCDLVGPNRDDE